MSFASWPPPKSTLENVGGEPRTSIRTDARPRSDRSYGGGGRRLRVGSRGSGRAFGRSLLALEVDDAVVALRRLPAHVALVDLAVHLDPRADHEVRLHRRLRLEVEVTTLGPLDPPVVEAAEPAVAVPVLRRVGGGDVHGHPAETRREEARPAAIARVVVLPLVRVVQTAPVDEAARDPARAAQRDEQRVLVGAAVPRPGEALLRVAEALAGRRRADLRVVVRLPDDVVEALPRLEDGVRLRAADLVRDHLDLGRDLHVQLVVAELFGERAPVVGRDRAGLRRVGEPAHLAAAQPELGDDL